MNGDKTGLLGEDGNMRTAVESSESDEDGFGGKIRITDVDKEDNVL